MMLLKSAILGLMIAAAAASGDIVRPRQPLQQKNPLGATNNSSPTIFGSNGTIVLKGTSSNPGVVILDYGSNVEGHPTFQVLSVTGDTSRLEVTYSESLAVLNEFYMV